MHVVTHDIPRISHCVSGYFQRSWPQATMAHSCSCFWELPGPSRAPACSCFYSCGPMVPGAGARARQRLDSAGDSSAFFSQQVGSQGWSAGTVHREAPALSFSGALLLLTPCWLNPDRDCPSLRIPQDQGTGCKAYPPGLRVRLPLPSRSAGYTGSA